MHLNSVDAGAFRADAAAVAVRLRPPRANPTDQFRPGQSFALHARRGDKLVRPRLAISYSAMAGWRRASAHRGEELFRPEAIDRGPREAFNDALDFFAPCFLEGS